MACKQKSIKVKAINQEVRGETQTKVWRNMREDPDWNA